MLLPDNVLRYNSACQAQWLHEEASELAAEAASAFGTLRDALLRHPYFRVPRAAGAVAAVAAPAVAAPTEARLLAAVQHDSESFHAQVESVLCTPDGTQDDVHVLAGVWALNKLRRTLALSLLTWGATMQDPEAFAAAFAVAAAGQADVGAVVGQASEYTSGTLGATLTQSASAPTLADVAALTLLQQAAQPGGPVGLEGVTPVGSSPPSFSGPLPSMHGMHDDAEPQGLMDASVISAVQRIGAELSHGGDPSSSLTVASAGFGLTVPIMPDQRGMLGPLSVPVVAQLAAYASDHLSGAFGVSGLGELLGGSPPGGAGSCSSSGNFGFGGEGGVQAAGEPGGLTLSRGQSLSGAADGARVSGAEVQEEGDAAAAPITPITPITRVLAWVVIDVTEFEGSGEGGRPVSVVRSVLRALHSDPMFSDPDEWDVVLVENQPWLKNPSMKTVQVAINAFFELYIQQRGANDQKHVVLVNARNKVNDIVSKKSTYKERKRASVEACTAMLDAMDGAEEAREALKNSKKKDDLCDEFMQANWYCCNQRAGLKKASDKAAKRKRPQNAPTQVGAPQVADAGHSGALAGVLAVVQAQAQQIASLVDVVSLLGSTYRRLGGLPGISEGGLGHPAPAARAGRGPEHCRRAPRSAAPRAAATATAAASVDGGTRPAATHAAAASCGGCEAAGVRGFGSAHSDWDGEGYESCSGGDDECGASSSSSSSDDDGGIDEEGDKALPRCPAALTPGNLTPLVGPGSSSGGGGGAGAGAGVGVDAAALSAGLATEGSLAPQVGEPLTPPLPPLTAHHRHSSSFGTATTAGTPTAGALPPSLSRPESLGSLSQHGGGAAVAAPATVADGAPAARGAATHAVAAVPAVAGAAAGGGLAARTESAGSDGPAAPQQQPAPQVSQTAPFPDTHGCPLGCTSTCDIASHACLRPGGN
ncbi:hypothetical protein FOA52_015947, partial [Chlamydomonas sp. UWO 241]